MLAAAFIVTATAADKDKKKAHKAHPTGYTDTPMLPGEKWRVHDDSRPRPKVVTAGKKYGEAPSDAIVMFDGSDLSQWKKDDGSAGEWIVKDGYMEVPPKKSGKGGYLFTKKEFGDMQLHIEWRTPDVVVGDSQGRGNSGVLLMGQYEVQVLDSFDNKTYADGQASSLYGWKPPLVNASRKPGEWQTYDIIFEAPKFDDEGKVIKKAYVTVFHNGVLTQHRQSYLGRTGHKAVAVYKKHPAKMSFKLQDHGNPMRYRNIWVRELDFDSNN
ncbi:MAG: DUF1080 domain-containing protein [Verrucomicrobia bacterium]|nr:DUF1080 domain-containing protein [Verrucomicrobiota bacterium]